MQLETTHLKTQIRGDLLKLDELRSRLEARLKAIEIVEQTAGEFQAEDPAGNRSGANFGKN